MNNAQLYLAWLRTTSPEVYMSALRRVTGQARTLGGLDSDLCQSMTAPATFGAFGQDDASDTSLPIIDVTAPADTSFDYTLPTIDTSTLATPDIGSQITMPNIDVSAPAPISAPAASGSSNWLAAFTTAVGSVSAAALTASNQSNLIKLNTTRAQQGLPPVNANGQIVQGSMLAPATSAIYALESRIAGATGGVGTPLIMFAGIGLLAFMLLRKR